MKKRPDEKDNPCFGCMCTTVCLADVISSHPNAKQHRKLTEADVRRIVREEMEGKDHA